jgi:GNAT superfamily N-acetyltransferase
MKFSIKQKQTKPITKNYQKFISLFSQRSQNIFNEHNSSIRFVQTDSSSTNRKTKRELVFTDKFINPTTESKCLFFPYQNGVCLHILQISSEDRGQGLGSEIMRIVREISNENGIPIYLIPVSIDSTPLEVLRRFYHKFGYKRESMKSFYWKYNPNYNTDSASLIQIAA